MSSVTLLTTLVLLMNASRADAHVSPLREDPALQARAQERAAGHGGASGRYDTLHENAFEWAFVLAQLGITK